MITKSNKHNKNLTEEMTKGRLTKNTSQGDEAKAIKVIQECFNELSFQIQNNNLDNILKLLKLINNTAVQSETNFHGELYFQFLIQIWKMIPDDETQIFIYIICVIDQMIENSDEAIYEYMKSGIIEFFCLKIQTRENRAVNSLILDHMHNIAFKAKDDANIFIFCIQNHFIEIFINEFNTLISDPSIESDVGIRSKLKPVMAGLFSFLLFPDSLSPEFLFPILKAAVIVLNQRYQNDFFGEFVGKLINNVNASMKKCDQIVELLCQSGFYGEVLKILEDDHSSFWADAFFFLGAFFSIDLPIVECLSKEINVQMICSHVMVLNDDYNMYLEGFYFFLTNFLTIQNDIIANLFDSGFFHFCFNINLNLNYRVQKSFCYFIISVLCFADEKIIIDLLSKQNFVDNIFDFLLNAKSKLVLSSLRSIARVISVVPNLSLQIPYFIESTQNFIDYLYLSKNEEILAYTEDVKNALESV